MSLTLVNTYSGIFIVLITLIQVSSGTVIVLITLTDSGIQWCSYSPHYPDSGEDTDSGVVTVLITLTPVKTQTVV